MFLTSHISKLEIHFDSAVSEKYIEPIVDDLWLQGVTLVEGVLRWETLWEVKVGGLWSGFVDLDGLDVGVVVEHDNATLTTTLYAKYVHAILVDGENKKTW